LGWAQAEDAQAQILADLTKRVEALERWQPDN